MAASEHRGRVMASELHVIVVGGTPGLIETALRSLDTLEHRWSRFLPTSDITRLNLSTGGPVAVAAETITLVATMIDAWETTGGAFDPTILPVLVANGYRASLADTSLMTLLPDGPTRAGMEGIEIDQRRSTVTVPLGVMLDPGGIGKGLAADLIVAQLLDGGAAGALVGIGGDLAMAGEPADPAGWIVGVEHVDPADGELCSFAVDAGGVATSSTRSRRWMLDGRARHHVIDPATGRQADSDLAAVTVIAGSGWAAEAHATGALLAGRDGVLDYLAVHDLSGLAVALDGTTVATVDLARVMGLAGVR